ncbi:MAG TPA: hypothetical protein VFH92_07330 [Phenylobacterium sp.]|nr:hypothetical protein [Phenylobacterium sp.]
MELKPGSRWKSAVCTTETVVVRPPSAPGVLECGGQPMLAHAAEKPEGLSPAAGLDGGATVGKRYADAETGLEVLCAKGGQGTLSLSGRPLELKEAKKLPASD